LSFACTKEDFFGKSPEKKILSFTLENQAGNTQINQENRTVSVTVSANATLTALKPVEIITSTFARISPAVGEVRDFSAPVVFTVIAEDGSAVDYTVVVKQEGAEPQLDNTNFNAWYTTPKGYEEPGIDASSIWATGNAGTVTLGSPNVTPMVISGDDRAVKLVTLDLGSLAGLIGQRMAAGSLFTGKFQLDIANPLNSTKFGIPFSARPKKFSVKYAYLPGSTYLGSNGQAQSKKDSCDIYMFLENREGPQVKRIATGWFRSGDDRSDRFYTITTDLIYGSAQSSLPAYQRPANNSYGTTEKVTHLTVVFSSSYNGALFEGGVNSTLVVNDFQLVY
jgi:hypothetical protein